MCINGFKSHDAHDTVLSYSKSSGDTEALDSLPRNDTLDPGSVFEP